MTPTPKEKDKRGYHRFPKVSVTELRKPETENKVKGCLIDISLGGAGFESQTDFIEGNEVLMEFHIPIEVLAEVVRVEQKGPLKKYGVTFKKLGKVERQLLERFVAEQFKK